MDIISPIVPIRSNGTKWPSTSVKCHSSASNLNSKSVMLYRAHTAKTFPDLNMTLRENWLHWLWALTSKQSGISTNASNRCSLALLSLNLKEIICNQHKAGVFGVVLGWNILLNAYQVLAHKLYANKLFSSRFSLETAQDCMAWLLWKLLTLDTFLGEELLLNLNKKHYGRKNKREMPSFGPMCLLYKVKDHAVKTGDAFSVTKVTGY